MFLSKSQFKLVLLTVFTVLSFYGQTQTCNFDFTSPNTGNNMIVLIHGAALEATILVEGDSIGAFMNIDDDWVCVGSTQWDGQQQVIAVWGDDIMTTIQDGLSPNQEIVFKAKSVGKIFSILYSPTLEYVSNDVKTIDTSLGFVEFCNTGSEVNGCMSPDFIEFNPFATIDDGSCTYASSYFSSPDISVIPITDNNMSIIFSTGVLSDYAGMIIQAFNGSIQVSEAVIIEVDGMAGITINGTDDFCNCNLVTNGDVITFSIFDSENYSVLNIQPENQLIYQANGFLGISSISFIVHQPISLQLTNGWNMVGYTGSAVTSIIEAMPVNFADHFFLIKDVNGSFWNSLADMLGTLTPGEGYMMNVYPEVTAPIITFSEVYNSNIEYQLTNGWNMVAFTGANETSITEAMPTDFQDDFFLIKDVNGSFWNSLVDMLQVLTPGKAYMMNVYIESNPPPLLNFTD